MGLATALLVLVAAVVVADTIWSAGSIRSTGRCSRLDAGSQSMLIIVVMVFLIAWVGVAATVFLDVNALVVAIEVAVLASSSSLYGSCPLIVVAVVRAAEAAALSCR